MLFSPEEGHSIIFTPEKEMPPIPAACLVPISSSLPNIYDILIVSSSVSITGWGPLKLIVTL